MLRNSCSRCTPRLIRNMYFPCSGTQTKCSEASLKDYLWSSLVSKRSRSWCIRTNASSCFLTTSLLQTCWSYWMCLQFMALNFLFQLATSKTHQEFPSLITFSKELDTSTLAAPEINPCRRVTSLRLSSGRSSLRRSSLSCSRMMYEWEVAALLSLPSQTSVSNGSCKRIFQLYREKARTCISSQ